MLNKFKNLFAKLFSRKFTFDESVMVLDEVLNKGPKNNSIEIELRNLKLHIGAHMKA